VPGSVSCWAKQYNAKVAEPTFVRPNGTYKQNIMLTRLAQIYSNFETLGIATSKLHELFAMSGAHPYKEAKLGVLQKGVADMLLVNGNLYRTSTC